MFYWCIFHNPTSEDVDDVILAFSRLFVQTTKIQNKIDIFAPVYLVNAILSVFSMVATAGAVSLALIVSSEGFRPSRSRKSSLKNNKTMLQHGRK